MIGLDSNVLLRYFAQDDAVHSVRATQLIDRQLRDDDPGFVSLVTLAEVVWTLSSRYKLNDQEIVQVLQRMLSTRRFVLQNAREIFIAMIALEGGAEFADALIGALGDWAGCSTTLTFDRKAARFPHFKLL